MASKDFIVKNGLRIGGSSGTGSLTAGDASFLTSLSAATLSGVGTALTTNFVISACGDVDDASSNVTALNGTYTIPFELKNTGVTANTYGSSTAIPAITVDEDGRITAASTNTIATDLTVDGDSGAEDVSLLTDDLQILGTANQISTAVTKVGTDVKATLSLPTNVTIPGDITLGGNTIVNSEGTGMIELNSTGVEICGNLTVQGTCTLLNQAVTATTTATENNFVIRSTDTGADASPDLKLWRDSSDPDNNDFIGNIFFTGTNSAAEATDYAHILGQITDVTDGSEDARLTFKTMAGGTLADRLTINSGKVGIGVTEPNHELTVAGTLSAGTAICAPTINASTSFSSPTLSGTTVCGDSGVFGTASIGGGFGSSGISIGADGTLCSNGTFSIGTDATNACLTVAGTISASGVVYADSFNSVTGGSTIDFNDAVDLGGTLTLSNGLNGGTTDSILIEDSGVVKKRTVDSRVWGSSLIDGTGNANRLAKFTDADTIADSTISDDGSDIILGITNTTVKVDDDATAGSIQFNGNKSAFHTTGCTIANAASGVLVSIPIANYRTGKIIISAKGESACTSHVETTEILLIHDGTTAYTTEYATIRSGDAVGEYHGVINSGNLELRACNELGGSATATFVTAIQHLTV